LGRRGTELARKLLTFLCEKCTKNAFFHTKYLKKFLGRKHSPSPYPTTTGEGDTFSSDPIPLGTFGTALMPFGASLSFPLLFYS